MIPGTVDLEAYHGDSWSQTFRLTKDGAPLDLSNSTVASEMIGRSGTSIGQKISLTAVKGTDPGSVTISFPDTAPPPGDYSYDVEVTTGSDVQTWIRGNIKVIPDVTA